jgi:predicted nucleic acid-binding protein
MTRSAVIVDTGILVALIDARDQHHDWVRTNVIPVISPWIT